MFMNKLKKLFKVASVKEDEELIVRIKKLKTKEFAYSNISYETLVSHRDTLPELYNLLTVIVSSCEKEEALSLPYIRPKEKHLLSWLSNEGKYFKDLTSSIHTLLDIYIEVYKHYLFFVDMKKSNGIFSFNSRKLEPYIIELEDTIGILEDL